MVSLPKGQIKSRYQVKVKNISGSPTEEVLLLSVKELSGGAFQIKVQVLPATRIPRAAVGPGALPELPAHFLCETSVNFPNGLLLGKQVNSMPDSHQGKRELTPASCFLNSTRVVCEPNLLYSCWPYTVALTSLPKQLRSCRHHTHRKAESQPHHSVYSC